MKHPPLLFLDTETLGLDVNAPIWEIAAIRLAQAPGVDQWHSTEFSGFVDHVDPLNYLATLPKSFQDDYRTRYDPENCWGANAALARIADMAEGAIVVGSNPQFDMQRIEKLAGTVEFDDAIAWHYHAIDMPTMIHGYLCGKGIYPAPPWGSDLLSQMVGVDPKDFDRHTAMGDARWCLAMWNAVTWR